MTALTDLRSLLNERERRTLFWITALAVLHGTLQGISILLLVPLASAISEGSEPRSWRWLGILTVAVICTGAAGYLQSVGGVRLAIAAMRTLHLRVGDHLARLPLGWFSGRSGSLSDLVSRGTLTVGGSSGYLLTPLVTLSSSMVTIALGLLLVRWQLGVTAMVLALLALLGARAATTLMGKGDAEQHAATIEANDRILEFARSQGAIRASAVEGSSYEPLEDALADAEVQAKRGLVASILGVGLNGIVAQVVFSALVVTLVLLLLSGAVDPLEMLALFAVIARFVEPLNEISGFRSGLRTATSEISRLRELLDTPAMPETHVPVQPEHRGIEIEHVSFSYEIDQPVLRDVSVSIADGEMLAIVGPSGAGKSTLMQLIARLYDPAEGRVLIGGVDVRDQALSDHMNQIAMVFQDVYLFEGSLRDNVLVGNPDATSEELEDAARLSGVAEIVSRIPQGWEAPVGEGGVSLSGGERQRVSIARALIKPSPILLLDEATAALDPENERVVSGMIEHARGTRTIVAIAHRLPTIVSADRILVLAGDGSVAETGSHHDLLEAEGIYTQFWRAREAADGWSMSVG